MFMRICDLDVEKHIKTGGKYGPQEQRITFRPIVDQNVKKRACSYRQRIR